MNHCRPRDAVATCRARGRTASSNAQAEKAHDRVPEPLGLVDRALARASAKSSMPSAAMKRATLLSRSSVGIGAPDDGGSGHRPRNLPVTADEPVACRSRGRRRHADDRAGVDRSRDDRPRRRARRDRRDRVHRHRLRAGRARRRHRARRARGRRRRSRGWTTSCARCTRSRGCCPRSSASDVDVADAQDAVLEYVEAHVPAPGVGAAVRQQHRHRPPLPRSTYMRELDDYLHYRSIDVSSLKELCRRWYPAIYTQAARARPSTTAPSTTSASRSKSSASTASSCSFRRSNRRDEPDMTRATPVRSGARGGRRAAWSPTARARRGP